MWPSTFPSGHQALRFRGPLTTPNNFSNLFVQRLAKNAQSCLNQKLCCSVKYQPPQISALPSNRSAFRVLSVESKCSSSKKDIENFLHNNRLCKDVAGWGLLNRLSNRFVHSTYFNDDKLDTSGNVLPSAAWKAMVHALSEELHHLRGEISQVKEGLFKDSC